GVLRAFDVGAYCRVQGHATRPSGGNVLQGPAGPARRIGARARASAFLDEPVSALGPRAPVSPDRTQRRDQHPAWQCELDTRTPRRYFKPDFRSRSRQGMAADL